MGRGPLSEQGAFFIYLAVFCHPNRNFGSVWVALCSFRGFDCRNRNRIKHGILEFKILMRRGSGVLHGVRRGEEDHSGVPSGDVRDAELVD